MHQSTGQKPNGTFLSQCMRAPNAYYVKHDETNRSFIYTQKYEFYHGSTQSDETNEMMKDQVTS